MGNIRKAAIQPLLRQVPSSIEVNSAPRFFCASFRAMVALKVVKFNVREKEITKGFLNVAASMSLARRSVRRFEKDGRS